MHRTLAIFILLSASIVRGGTPAHINGAQTTTVRGAGAPERRPQPDIPTPIDLPMRINRHSGGLSKYDGGTFATRGITEGRADTGWVEQNTISTVYEQGRISRQAIFTPRVWTRRNLVTTHTYDYGSNGLVVEERTTGAYFLWEGGVSLYDEVLQYTYNDSNRVEQMLLTRNYAVGGYVTRSRYMYQNQVVPLSMLQEVDEGSGWRVESRATYYHNAAGQPDSIIVEVPYTGTWGKSSKIEYSRPRIDSLVETRSNMVSDLNGAHARWEPYLRISTLYDGQRNLLSEMIERFGPSVSYAERTTYSYDPDGVMRSSRHWGGNGYIETQRFNSSRMPAPSVLLVLPNAGERYFSTDTIAVRFLGTGGYFVNLQLSTDNGASWTEFATGLPDTGVTWYGWVPGKWFGTVKLRAVAGPASDAMTGSITILPGREELAHTTSTIQCGVFSTGYLGRNADGKGPGFRYKGYPNALFSGGIVYGQPGRALSGAVASFRLQTLAPDTPLTAFTSDAVFDQRTSCTLVGDTSYNVQIRQETASRISDDFIITSYRVKNLSDSTLSEFYVGMFADWDIAQRSGGQGGIDSARGLAYQFDPSGPDKNYYGVVALTPMSGAAVTSLGPDVSYLLGPQPMTDGTTYDLRTFVGSGPYTIPPLATRTATFAMVAGTSLAELRLHADSAIALWRRQLKIIQVKLSSPLPGSKVSDTIPVRWSLGSSARADNVFIEYSSDRGKVWRRLCVVTRADSLFLWNTRTVRDGTRYLLRIQAWGDSAYGSDQIPERFTINNPGNAEPEAEVSLPDSNQQISGVQLLRWWADDADGDSLSISIDVSSDGGMSWTNLTLQPNTGVYAWDTREAPNSPNYQLWFRAQDAISAYDVVSPFFVVANTRQVLQQSLVEHRSGVADGVLKVNVVDPSKVTGHRYRVVFDQLVGGAKGYSVTDLDRNVVVLKGGRLSDAEQEGPQFDGLRLVTKDFDPARISTDSTRWVAGASNLMPKVSLPNFYNSVGGFIVGTPFASDYAIRVFDHVVDTSSALFGWVPVPMTFTVRNLTYNRKVEVLYVDLNSDNSIGLMDDLLLIERDSVGNSFVTWEILFPAASNPTLPSPGDVFRLKILKPFTRGDVYEFVSLPSGLVAVKESLTPTSFRLEQNYPNPFNPLTVINYSLPSSGSAQAELKYMTTLKVYDLLGREVATLVNGLEEPGMHQVTVNASGLASGAYLYRLTSGIFMQTRKMIILR